MKKIGLLGSYGKETYSILKELSSKYFPQSGAPSACLPDLRPGVESPVTIVNDNAGRFAERDRSTLLQAGMGKRWALLH